MRRPNAPIAGARNRLRPRRWLEDSCSSPAPLADECRPLSESRTSLEFWKGSTNDGPLATLVCGDLGDGDVTMRTARSVCSRLGRRSDISRTTTSASVAAASGVAAPMATCMRLRDSRPPLQMNVTYTLQSQGAHYAVPVYSYTAVVRDCTFLRKQEATHTAARWSARAIITHRSSGTHRTSLFSSHLCCPLLATAGSERLQPRDRANVVLVGTR